MRFLLILPAVFGIALCGSSGEVYLGYDPLQGPPQGAHGPAVVQNHGAVGDPVAAKAGIEQGGSSNGYSPFDFPANAQGPAIVQQHGYNGNPMVNYNTGGSSQGNGAQNAPQVGQNAYAGGSSQNNDGAGGALAGNINPQIIPTGDDSGDQDYIQAFGNIPPQTGGQQNAGGSNFGGPGFIPNAGDSSNDVDLGAAGGAVGAAPAKGNGNPWSSGNNVESNPAPNAAPVAGGGDVGVMAHQNYETASSGMSGAAVAGVIVGVVAVGAVGTAVAVVLMKSSASAGSAV